MQTTQLPEWQRTIEEQPRPDPELRDKVEITPNTDIVVYQSGLLGGSARSFLTTLHRGWPVAGNEMERRNATLRFVLAEFEEALPIVRAMVERIGEETAA